jgi:hypothetical protein
MREGHPVSTAARFNDLLRNLKAARFAEAEALENLITAVLETAAPTPSPPRVNRVDDESYLSVRQLTARIPYAEKTIRNLMTRGQLTEGVHFFKCRGRIMFSWLAMRAWVEGQSAGGLALPLVRNRNGHP